MTFVLARNWHAQNSTFRVHNRGRPPLHCVDQHSRPLLYPMRSGRSLGHPHSDLQGIDEPWRIGWGPSARQCYSNRRRHPASVRKIDCQVAQSSAGAKTQIALAPCSPFSVSETLMRIRQHWQNRRMSCSIPILRRLRTRTLLYRTVWGTTA